MRTTLAAALVATALTLPTGAGAQNFPTRPVSIIVPTTPGGSNDVIGRLLATELGKIWGQTVTVDNKPGAGGSVGMALLTRARPDGHTLAFMSSSVVVTAATSDQLPYNARKDVTTVAIPVTGQLMMVTGNRVPMRTVADIVEQAKKQTIFYAGNGLNTSTFAGAQFAAVTGIQMTRANYSGGAEALTDIAGRRVDLYIGTLATIDPFIQQGAVHPVAILDDERDPNLPNTPTIVEAGFPGARFPIFWGLFAPAGTPDAVKARINAAVTEIVNSPAGRETLAKFSTRPTRLSVAESEKQYVDMFTTVQDLAKKLGN